MTQVEYRTQKLELEGKLDKLEREYANYKKDNYEPNVGKYYKCNCKDMYPEFGKIISVGDEYPSYMCKEISINGDCVYYSTSEGYIAKSFFDMHEIISKEEFMELFNDAINNVRKGLDIE